MKHMNDFLRITLNKLSRRQLCSKVTISLLEYVFNVKYIHFYRKLMICVGSLMVVHSQPVCPPYPHSPPPSPFKFARFGMSASTELLSFYSSIKKLCVSIICMVAYNWGRGKGTGCGRVGVDKSSWWWM